MKIKLLFISSLILTACLYSCSQDDSPNVPAEGDTGAPTYMDLSFTFPKSNTPKVRVTRAATTGDNNASLSETAINTVDIYIFNPNTGIMMKHDALTVNDFVQQASTANEDVWKAKATISTTTGQKTVFVGVNLPASLSSELEGNTLTAFNDKAYSLGLEELVTDKGIAMFSSNGVTSELKPVGDPAFNANNNIKIPIKRLVTKVTVEESKDMKVNGPGSLTDLRFAINNINRKLYLVPKADGSDPNYQANSWIQADFFDANNIPGQTTDGYKPVNAANVNDVSILNSLYTTENTSVNHWKEEITRATVRARFVPDNILQRNGNGFQQISNKGKNPVTFWTVLLQNGYKEYFIDETAADAYESANPGSIKSSPYTDGYCYYDLFLNKEGNFNGTNVSSKRWDVFRNDYYRCRITSILAPGRPNPGVVDPKVPPAVETDLQIEIDILFWNLVTSDYSLEP